LTLFRSNDINKYIDSALKSRFSKDIDTNSTTKVIVGTIVGIVCAAVAAISRLLIKFYKNNGVFKVRQIFL